MKLHPRRGRVRHGNIDLILLRRRYIDFLDVAVKAKRVAAGSVERAEVIVGPGRILDWPLIKAAVPDYGAIDFPYAGPLQHPAPFGEQTVPGRRDFIPARDGRIASADDIKVAVQGPVIGNSSAVPQFGGEPVILAQSVDSQPCSDEFCGRCRNKFLEAVVLGKRVPAERDRKDSRQPGTERLFLQLEVNVFLRCRLASGLGKSPETGDRQQYQ